MAHELAMKNGRASMAYVGDTPWHKLGQLIAPGATIEDIRDAAGYGFSIEKGPAKYIDASGQERIIPNFSALYRSDNGDFISLRSETRFNVVQPAEILEFYRDLIDATDGDFSFETAGVLQGGRKLWCLARANDEASVGRKDKILPYLLLTTANDGTMATTGKFTSVRVVCHNTLSMSLGRETAGEVRVPHSRIFDSKAVKMELGLIHQALKEFVDTANSFTKIKLNDRQAQDFFMRLYGPEPTVDLDVKIPSLESEDYSTASKNTIKALMNAYVEGPGSSMPEAMGTLWGALNAVTYHQDHAARTRRVGGISENEARLYSSEYGQGSRLKRNAVDLALAFLS